MNLPSRAQLMGALDPGFEYFRAERPTDPAVRDSATFWIMDAAGGLACPRVTFDAIGDDWESPCLQLNYVEAGGRTLRLWTQAPGGLSLDERGRAAIRSAGPLEFQCIEPFRRWTMAFDGLAQESSSAVQMAGHPDGEAVPLAFRFEAEMAAPPWLMGGLNADAARNMKAGDAAALMGGIRYEQLCRIKGFVETGGVRHTITGTGMRVRRQGVRNMGAAIGHCQHSALFPSGRAFGAIIMAPGPEGPEVFNEAFIYTENGQQVAARVVQAPWMTRFAGQGGDASLVLDSGLGSIRIAGEVQLSLFDHHHFEMAPTSILHQGTARYIWDGEETIGLIERCTLRNRLGAMPA